MPSYSSSENKYYAIILMSYIFFRVQRNSLKKWTSQHRAEIRQKILQHTEVNQLNAAKGIELLAAQRWLDRLVAHTHRFSNVLYESILKNEERKFKNGC